MMVQTNLADSIDASDSRAKLDAVAKKLIRHRIILAEILKECVEEFHDCEAGYIEQNCIIGDVRVDEISVDQDKLDADTSITAPTRKMPRIKRARSTMTLYLTRRFRRPVRSSA